MYFSIEFSNGNRYANGRNIEREKKLVVLESNFLQKVSKKVDKQAEKAQ